MSLWDERQQDTIRALHGLVAAFSEPGSVNPAHADHVLAQAARLLDTVDAPTSGEGRPRMPTATFPRAAALDEPDEPPVPPAAL